MSACAIYESDMAKPCGPPLQGLSVSSRFSVQIIALADAATTSQQPRTVDKITKITHSFIRDLSDTVHFSFHDARYNLADSGTKIQGNIQILLKLRKQRVFGISFVGRR